MQYTHTHCDSHNVMCTHIHARSHTHTHKYTHTHTHANLAPSGAPGELRVSRSHPTTAQLSWSPVPWEKQNGVITGYKVQIEGPDLRWEIQVEDAKTTSLEIPNLKPFTPYAFKVSAINKVGTGPIASVLSRTPEGGKVYMHRICNYCAIEVELFLYNSNILY